MFGNTKVIKNDVKWICRTLKDNEKWKKKIDENVGKCPAEKRINGLEDYDEGQNEKIGNLVTGVATLSGKMSVWFYILISITTISVILGIVTKVFGGEQELPHLEEECFIPVQQRVEAYIETWNEFSKATKSTGHFGYRKDNDVYVLQVVGINFCTCKLCLPIHENMFLALSREWLSVSNSKRLEVIKNGIIRVYVNSKGKFFVVGKILL